MEIVVECEDCGGTGLYSGFCEGQGKAVVCLGCGGTGAQKLRFKEYTGRKRKNDINSISYSRGTFIATGVGAVGESMSYSQFKDKIPQYPVR